MQMTINIGYDQLYEMVRQLPPRERIRLVEEITPAKQEPDLSDAEPPPELIVLERGNGYTIVQVPFPDTEEGRIRKQELEQVQKKVRENHPEIFVPSTKDDIEKKRQEALRLALECPVATQEDIDNQNEFRKQFRCRPM